MANLVSLATLRGRAQYASDMENDPNISNTIWGMFLNYGAQRLHDILVNKGGEEYAISSGTINITNGTNTYDLPADFYRMKGIDVSNGARTYTLRRFQFREREKYNWATINWGGHGGVPVYMLQGHQVRFQPMPSINTTATIWYVPTMQVLVHGTGSWTSAALVNDDDCIDDVNGYAEYIVLEAAIRAMIKQDRDPSGLIAQRDEVKAWIESSAAQRDSNDPMYIGEVNGDGLHAFNDGMMGW